MNHEADDGERPLSGVVLCSTNLLSGDRDKHQRIVKELGGRYIEHLTQDVTHLVVGKVGTLKYQFVARERPDIKAVTPEWIDAVRALWEKGDLVDVALAEAQYRAPVLLDLHISITGFNEAEERQSIIDAIADSGAKYEANLTPIVTVLIVAEPQGKKYEWACKWNIKTVSIEWLRDSLRRGMALEEKYYSPLTETAERGKGAFKTLKEIQALPQKRSAGDSGILGDSKRTDMMRKRLRRTASAKLQRQNSSLWSEVAADFSVQVQQNDWDPPSDVPGGAAGASPLGRDPEGDKDTPTITAPYSRPPSNESSDRSRSKPTGIFQRRILFIHGFDEAKTKRVYQFLPGNGAELPRSDRELSIYSEDEIEDGFLVIPHDVAADDLPPIPAHAHGLTRVTEWWIEQCLHSKKFVDPLNDPFCRALPNLRVKGFENLSINGTGFTGAHSMHFQKLVRLMGATYVDFFNEDTSVLVCESVREDKVAFAAQQSIPAVRVDWLWQCIRAGKVQPFNEYLLDPINLAEDSLPQSADELQVKAEASLPPAAPLNLEQIRAQQRISQQPKQKLTRQGSSHRTQSQLRHKSLESLILSRSGAKPREDSTISNPLQEIEPHVNSSKPPSQRGRDVVEARHDSLDARKSKDNDSNASPSASVTLWPGSRRSSDSRPHVDDNQIPSVDRDPPSESLKDSIVSLLAQRQNSNTDPSNSGHQNAAKTAVRNDRRKRGLLGRASSLTSDCPPLSVSSRANSVVDDRLSVVTSFPAEGSRRSTRHQSSRRHESEEQGTEARDHSMNASMSLDMSMMEPIPSQALLYEDPRVTERREKMVVQMGGTVERRAGLEGVKGIGIVRDVVRELDASAAVAEGHANSVGGGGIAGRVKRRR